MPRTLPRRPLAALTRLAAPVLALAACVTALPEAPTPAPTLAGRRRQDLEWLTAALVARHPDPFGRVGESTFRRAVAELSREGARSPSGEWFLGLMRVVALVHDSHTRLSSWDPIEGEVLPVTFAPFQDEYWVAAVQEGLADLTAHRVLAIGGVPIETLETRLGRLVPAENDVVRRRGVAKLLSYPLALRAVHAMPARGPAEIETVDLAGTPETWPVEALAREQIDSWLAYAPPGWTQPLASSRPGVDWWWTDLDDGHTVYFHYAACHDGTDPDFATFARELLARLDGDTNVHLVVDLRANGGGDSRVLRPLLRGLARLRHVRVTGLIGPGTYSSAMLNAWQLRQDLGAELVGEPTGQRPNSFGELSRLTLPNSGLELDVSTKRFRIVDGDPPGIEPDRTVLTTFEDHFRGRDPVLDAVR